MTITELYNNAHIVSRFTLMLMMNVDTPVVSCILMHQLYLDAPRWELCWCSHCSLMYQDVLVVGQCSKFALMHFDDQIAYRYPYCTMVYNEDWQLGNLNNFYTETTSNLAFENWISFTLIKTFFISLIRTNFFLSFLNDHLVYLFIDEQ